MICKVDGCNKKIYKDEYCANHYMELVVKGGEIESVIENIPKLIEDIDEALNELNYYLTKHVKICKFVRDNDEDTLAELEGYYSEDNKEEIRNISVDSVEEILINLKLSIEEASNSIMYNGAKMVLKK